MTARCGTWSTHILNADDVEFLTPDPIGHEDGLNLYAYCENNPVNAVDPEGTQARNLSDSRFASHRNDPLGSYGRIPHTPLNYTLSHWIDKAQSFDRMLIWALPFKREGYRNSRFYAWVKPGGPMDFKHFENRHPVEFDAHYQELVDYGNFNFGVIGRGLGFDTDYLMWAGGAGAKLVNFRHGKGWAGYSGDEPPTYGDQVRDNFFIRMGMNWYDRNHGGKQ